MYKRFATAKLFCIVGSFPLQSILARAIELAFRLRQLGKVRTSETYSDTLNSFMAFHKGLDVPVDGISSHLMLLYEAYLLPIIKVACNREQSDTCVASAGRVQSRQKTEGHNDERRQYDNAMHLVNCRLKELSAMLKLQRPLTMYVARHSWASAAKANHVPLSVISQGMGHDS